MMNQMLAILCLLPAVAFAVNCTREKNGNYEIGCRAFVICLNGTRIPVECGPGMEYDFDKGECGPEESVPLPCGNSKDCSNLEDGRYADTDNNCDTYYTCKSGIYLSRNLCPGGTVFSEDMQGCLFKRDVRPPCGTQRDQKPGVV